MRLRETLVRDLLNGLSGGANLFRRYGIDYYRIGHLRLWEAAARRGCDLELLVGDLSSLAPAVEQIPTTVRDLTTFIQRRYHAIHLNRLFTSIRLARRVELEFSTHEACPHGLGRHLCALADDLEAHQIKERDEVFPALRFGLRTGLKFPVLRMMMEHDAFAEQLDTIVALTRDFTPPAQANADWMLLYATCRHLDSDLRFHMHLENNLLYPSFVGERLLAG